MTDIKKINSLLSILKAYYKVSIDKDDMSSGLCHSALRIKHLGMISDEEHLYLDLYIKKNKPFTFYNLINTDGYWWEPYKTEPRLRWLSKHIKKTLK